MEFNPWIAKHKHISCLPAMIIGRLVIKEFTNHVSDECNSFYKLAGIGCLFAPILIILMFMRCLWGKIDIKTGILTLNFIFIAEIGRLCRFAMQDSSRLQVLRCRSSVFLSCKNWRWKEVLKVILIFIFLF